MIPEISTAKQRSLLIRHFLRHLLNSELIPRQAEAKVTLIQILALVSTPGFVIMCCLLRKYARIAPLSLPAAHLASLNEKCLFIYFSMVVVGFVAVLEWDVLFPDRRDYLILGTLPISHYNLFVSKAASLCIFLALFSVFVNVFPAVLYPLFASRGLLQAIRFLLSHTLSVFAADAFVFFACVAIQGFLLSFLGPRLFVSISKLVQLLLLVFLLTVFFLLPMVSFEKIRQNPVFLAFFAPAWFVGLYQTLLAGPAREFLPLASQALKALGLAATGFVLSYVLAYKGLLRRILETGRDGSTAETRIKAPLFPWLCRVFFRNPWERASFCYTLKTLLRSQSHRTYFGAYFGTGLAFVAMGLVTLFSRHGLAGACQIRSELLSIPLVMSFFLLVGMRAVFAIPADLGANWVFKLTEGERRRDCLSGVYKAMFILGASPPVVLFPFYLKFWSWPAALLHAAFCTILSLLLTEVLISRLDKMPFTCTYLPGKANLKVWWWVYLFGFTNYAYTMTELEQKLFLKPQRFIPFFACTLAILLCAAAYRNRLVGRLQALRYEAEPAPAAEPLVLT